MVFVHFPHPELLKDPTYQSWVTKRDEWVTDPQNQTEPDWRVLFDWLGEHSRIAHHRDAILSKKPSKCWYSEHYVSGNHGKDVEHFRPKNSATPLTSKQVKELKKQLGFQLAEAVAKKEGYPWLAYEPINYRLSHPHVNRTGAKGTVFNILERTRRLRKGSLPMPDQRSEYSFLLDPSNQTDAACLWVQPDGEIIPRFPTPMQFPANPKADWHTQDMQSIRACVSIVVYKLNHTDFKRGRSGVYQEALEQIKSLSRAIQTKNQALIDDKMISLMRMCSCASHFSLAARAALGDRIALLDNEPTQLALKRILTAIISNYEKRESPDSQ